MQQTIVVLQSCPRTMLILLYSVIKYSEKIWTNKQNIFQSITEVHHIDDIVLFGPNRQDMSSTLDTLLGTCALDRGS